MIIIITITHFPHSVFPQFFFHISLDFHARFNRTRIAFATPDYFIRFMSLFPVSLRPSWPQHHQLGLNGATKLACAQKRLQPPCQPLQLPPVQLLAPTPRWLFDILPRGWRAKQKRRLRMISCKYRLDLSALLYQYYACTARNKCTEIVGDWNCLHTEFYSQETYIKRLK